MEAVIDNRASEGRKITVAPINIAVWLLLPSTVLLLATFLYPLFSIAVRSFIDPELGLQNYTSLLTDDISIIIILRTLRIAAIVAVVTLLIGFPYAYMLTLVTPRMRAVLMTVALLPFWTSAIARSFAWTLLMQRGGLIETAFSWVGLPGMVLVRTSTGVTIAMAQVLLPYMILPLYSNMRGIDRRLLDAAASMGSPRWRAFLEIYLPLSLPGILAGLSLVFVIALGFYVTPAILGSPQEALVSQLIATRVDTLLDFGGAGALAVIVLLVAAALMALIGRLNARLDLQPNTAGK